MMDLCNRLQQIQLISEWAQYWDHAGILSGSPVKRQCVVTYLYAAEEASVVCHKHAQPKLSLLFPELLSAADDETAVAAAAVPDELLSATAAAAVVNDV